MFGFGKKKEKEVYEFKVPSCGHSDCILWGHITGTWKGTEKDTRWCAMYPIGLMVCFTCSEFKRANHYTPSIKEAQ